MSPGWTPVRRTARAQSHMPMTRSNTISVVQWIQFGAGPAARGAGVWPECRRGPGVRALGRTQHDSGRDTWRARRVLGALESWR